MRIFARFGILGLAASAALAAGCGTPAGSIGLHATRAQSRALAAPTTPSIVNFAKVDDKVYRGGEPADSDFASLKALGIQTDVCLLGVGSGDAVTIAHERTVAAKAGLTFVNIPIPSATTPDKTLVEQWLAQATGGNTAFVHCHHGRDRTGAMVGAYRVRHDGWTGQQALSEMETFGFDPNRFPALAQFVLGFSF